MTAEEGGCITMRGVSQQLIAFPSAHSHRNDSPRDARNFLSREECFDRRPFMVSLVLFNCVNSERMCRVEEEPTTQTFSEHPR